MVFNAHFNNISAISWRSVYWWREPEYPEKTTDLSEIIDKLYHIMLYRLHLSLICSEEFVLIPDFCFYGILYVLICFLIRHLCCIVYTDCDLIFNIVRYSVIQNFPYSLTIPSFAWKL